MNFILNLQCNNHCPYCFEHGFSRAEEEFTLENLEKVLQWAGSFPADAGIHILGGEPTLYKYFPQAINLIHSYYPDNRLVIISNLLGDNENIEYLKTICAKWEINLLVNTTIDNDKKELFFNRLKDLYEINTYCLCLSITMMCHPNINKKYIENIHYLMTCFPLIDSIRIGLQMPGGPMKFQRYCYDEDLRYLCAGIKNNTKVFFDCSAPYCLVTEECLNELQPYFGGETIRVGCPGPAVDLLPDFGAKYCFSSCEQYQVDNIFKFQNYQSLYQHLVKMEHFREINSKVCLNCKYFKEGVCLPCHGLDEAWAANE